MPKVQPSLTRKLIGAFALVFVVFFLCVDVVATRVLDRQIEANSERSIRALADNEARDIEEHFRRLESIGEASAKAVARWLNDGPAAGSGKAFDAKYRVIGGALRTDLSAFPDPDVSGVFLSNRTELTDEIKATIEATEGRFDDYARGIRTSVFNMYLITKDQLIRIYGKDWALQIEPDHDFTRDLFYSVGTPSQDPQKAPVWTTPYYDSIWKHWMISLITPIYLRGEFQGIVGHDVNLDDLYKQVLGKRFFGTGYGVIFDAHGCIVVHPGHLNLLSRSADMGTALGTLAPEDEVLSSLVKQVAGDPSSCQGVVIRRFQEDGKVWHLFARKLCLLDWYYAVIVPHEAIQDLLPRFQQSFIAGSAGATVVLLMATGLILWVYVLSPIAGLRRTVEEIRGGDLTRRAKVRSPDEIGQLGTSFNEMAGKLSDTLAELRGDIAERERAEEALKASEERHRSLVANVPVGLYTNTPGPQGRFVNANPAIAAMFGYDSVGEFLKVPVAALYERAEDRLAFSRRLEEGGDVAGAELELRRKDGTPIWGAVTARVVRGRSGEILCFDGMIQDITERKRAEEALCRSEARFRRIAEVSPLPMAIADTRTGTIEYVNPKAVEVFGYSLSEIPTFDAWMAKAYPDPAYRAKVEKVWVEDADAPATPWRREVTVTCRDGEVRHVVWSWVAFEASQRLVIADDLTEKKKALEERQALEIRLNRAKKMEALGLLAGGVAHDLNNILSGIVGYPELMLLDLPEESGLRQPLTRIQESGERAAAVVQDLLTIARGIASSREVANLNTIATDYLASPEHRASADLHPTVTVRTELTPDLLGVECSPVHLRKALMNLAVNAMEAIRGPGTVTIRTRNAAADELPTADGDQRVEGWVVLTVEDDGVGVAKGDLDRIFEPFYTKKVMGRSGTGLGLAVVWNTVQDHGGHIEVSTGTWGTRFEVYLPATRRSSPADAKRLPPGEYSGAGQTVLVVDDEENQRQVACEMLARLGYAASAVPSGEEAIARLREQPVDLVLLDMLMSPGLNGRQTYAELVRIRPGQRAVIASGFAETEDVEAARRLGAGGFLRKPYTLEKLGLALREALRAP